MIEWMMIAIGGALGAVSRFWISEMAHRFGGDAFPIGTLVANSLGCFLIGFLSILAEERFLLGPGGRLFVFVGFIGAFTTFSTFTFESWKLATDGEMIKTLLNVFSSLFLGFSSLFGGILLGRMVS